MRMAVIPLSHILPSVVRACSRNRKENTLFAATVLPLPTMYTYKIESNNQTSLRSNLAKHKDGCNA